MSDHPQAEQVYPCPWVSVASSPVWLGELRRGDELNITTEGQGLNGPPDQYRLTVVSALVRNALPVVTYSRLEWQYHGDQPSGVIWRQKTYYDFVNPDLTHGVYTLEGQEERLVLNIGQSALLSTVEGHKKGRRTIGPIQNIRHLRAINV